MSKCPNKSHPDWKAVQSVYGEDMAYLAYLRNNEDIPTINGAKHLLGITPDGVVLSHIDRDLMRRLTGFSNEAMADHAVAHLLNRYPDVNFFSDEEAYKNFVRTNFLRDIEVSAFDIGQAFENAVWVREGDFRQDRLLHELSHIYYDALPSDHHVKSQLRSIFSEQLGSSIEAEVDEAVVDAIGIYAHEHAEDMFPSGLYEKLKALMRQFWIAVKRLLGVSSKRDLIQNMAESVWNNRQNIGKELFQSDVVRHLLIPPLGGEVGLNVSDNGQDMMSLKRIFHSPTSIIGTLFGKPDMMMVEMKQEQAIINRIRSSYQGQNNLGITQAELSAQMYMRNKFNGMQADLGTAIHAVLANYFSDSENTPSHISDAYNDAKKHLNGDIMRKVEGIAERLKKRWEKEYPGIKFHPELTLAAPIKGLFGRLDLVGELPGDRYVVFDFKSSTESLFEEGSGGKRFSKKYVQVNGFMRMPNLSGNFKLSDSEMAKLHLNIQKLPNTKFRQHQVQGLTYKALVEAQNTSSGEPAKVEEVVFVPMVLDISPNVVMSTDKLGEIDAEKSGWNVDDINLDVNVVKVFSTRAHASVPQTSTAIREEKVTAGINTIINTLGLMELTSSDQTLINNIQRSIGRGDAVAAVHAMSAVKFLKQYVGKELSNTTSEDIQELLGEGLHLINLRAQTFILNQFAEYQKKHPDTPDIPENFLNVMSSEQVYWAAMGKYIPDFSDIANKSYIRTENHAIESMRYIDVPVKMEQKWTDTTVYSDYDYENHHGKEVQLIVNGGMQTVVFQEYGLTEVDNVIKPGVVVMLPPASIDKSDKGISNKLQFGVVDKLYTSGTNGNSFSVKVENPDTGMYSTVYVEHIDGMGSDSKSVAASNNYGVYVVRSASGIFNHNEQEVANHKGPVFTPDGWEFSFTNTMEEVMEPHFMPVEYMGTDTETFFRDNATMRSLREMWRIFEEQPTRTDFTLLFSDHDNDPILDRTYRRIASVNRQSDPDNPIELLVQAAVGGLMCHTLADDIRNEAKQPATILPTTIMNVYGIAMNSMRNPYNKGRLSAYDLENGFVGRHIINSRRAAWKLPRLIDAHHYGINTFKDRMAELYNDSQGAIATNVLTLKSLIEKAERNNLDVSLIMYQRPASKFTKTNPYVFRPMNDPIIEANPELHAILKFLDGLYKKTIPEFTKIDNTVAPLHDMAKEELGTKATFWRGRVVYLLGDKAYDNVKVTLPNGKQEHTLREWKRIFIEKYYSDSDGLKGLSSKELSGTFLSHLRYRWANHSSGEEAFTSSMLHYIDRQAREIWRKKNGGDQKNLVSESSRLRSSANIGSIGQSLIPTTDVKGALLSSVRDVIIRDMMGKISPTATYLYDRYRSEGNNLAADFVYGQMSSFFPSMRAADDSVFSRIVRTSAQLMSVKFLGMNLPAQQTNFLIGQVNNLMHDPKAFAKGWQLFFENPRKALRLLRYYKVISITDDLIYSATDNTTGSKLVKISMEAMQQVENLNHAIIFLGMLGERIYDNLDDSMVNEVDNNGNDTGMPKRGKLYRVDLDPSVADKVKSILLARGAQREEVLRTTSGDYPFVFCTKNDIKAIANTVGDSVENLLNASVVKKNDVDLPTKAMINRILMADIGSSQGDYRKTLNPYAASESAGQAMNMFRKYMASLWSLSVRRSSRDSNYELVISARTKLIADVWHVMKGFSSKEAKADYIKQLIDELYKHNMENANRFGLLGIEAKGWQGKQLAGIMVMNQLLSEIDRMDSSNLSVESFLQNNLSELGQQELDQLVDKLSSKWLFGARKGTIMTRHARNFIIYNLVALGLLATLAKPDDDETDSSNNVLLAVMPRWKRMLYNTCMGIWANGLGQFMPTKSNLDYAKISPLISGYRTFYTGKKDDLHKQTILEQAASTTEGQVLADFLDEIILRLPGIAGTYESANWLNPWGTDQQEQQQKAKLFDKYMDYQVQLQLRALQSEDPERYQQIIDAQGGAGAVVEKAKARILDQMQNGELETLDDFDYEFAKKASDMKKESFETKNK